MTMLGENSAVRLGLAVAACVSVAMISYQQGQIQASTPKEGQYVTALVFAATMDGVESKLLALKETVETRLGSISDAQDLRLRLVEDELGRLREDIIRMSEGKNAPASR